MDNEQISEQRLNEVARQQLASARHDPRCDRDRPAPPIDYADAVREVFRFRSSTWFALEALKSGSVGLAGDRADQVAWERRELAMAEIDGDLAWLNASTLIAMHGAVDALVEQLGPSVESIVIPGVVKEIFDRLRREHSDVAEITEERLEVLVAAATEGVLSRRRERPYSVGSKRWERRLQPSGLALPPERAVPSDLETVLVEACVLRNVLVHCSGRIDEKAVEVAGKESVMLSFKVDEFIRLTTAQTLEMAAALNAYGTDVATRLLTRGGIGEAIDFERWRDHGPWI